MSIDKKLMTVEEFEPYAFKQETQDRLLELIDGEVYEKMPTEEHGVAAARIVAYLLPFVEDRKLGNVGVEVRHRKQGDRRNSRIPDVSFRADATMNPVTRGSVPQMPDLAIEIFSPDDEYRELHEKARYYLNNGTRLVWLMFPRSRTVDVCRLAEDGTMHVQTLGVDDVLDGEDVVPGFTLLVKRVFNV